jgi:hypothetical protein
VECEKSYFEADVEAKGKPWEGMEREIKQGCKQEER